MERDHGVFWSRVPGISNRDKQISPNSQATSNLGQFADICPLCYLRLEEPKDARTGIPRATAASTMPTSNELPLDAGKMSSKISSAGSKKAKRFVRFDVTKHDSGPAREGAAPPTTSIEATKVDESGSQKITNTVAVMLDHIADHLQFLALLTPRLSTEKLAVGDVQAFISSQVSSSDRASGKRSTVNDELESAQGDEVEADEHGILQENLPPEAGTISELASRYSLESRPQNEGMGAVTPVDWSLYSNPRTVYDARGGVAGTGLLVAASPSVA